MGDAPARAAPALQPGQTFRCTIPLRWGDMDALNHLNNTIYFRLMEEARIQLFHASSMNVQPKHQYAILAHASCDFRKPLVYPATTVVTHHVTRVGRSSLTFQLVIENEAEPGLEYASGSNVLVWVDAETGRALPWPEHVLAALARTFGA